MVGRLDRRLRNYEDRHDAVRREYEPTYEPNDAYYPQEQEEEQYYDEDYPDLEKYRNMRDEIDNKQLIPPTEEGPLSIIDEIKKMPSPKGAHPTILNGVPVDLHVLEDYIIRISPYNIRTVNRYHSARTVEEIKGYGRFGTVKMKKMNVILLILLVGMAVLGIILIMFMPQITEMLQGMAP